MIKVASMLAAAYLSLAPGMDLARLLHSVELCRYFEVAAGAEHGHHHDHSDDQDAPDCPHHVNVESGVMPAAALPASVQAAPAFELQAAVLLAAAPVNEAPAALVERPPPNPPWVGVTLLLI